MTEHDKPGRNRLATSLKEYKPLEAPPFRIEKKLIQGEWVDVKVYEKQKSPPQYTALPKTKGNITEESNNIEEYEDDVYTN